MAGSVFWRLGQSEASRATKTIVAQDCTDRCRAFHVTEHFICDYSYDVCLCLCMFMYVHVYMYVCLLCVSVWREQNNLNCHSLGIIQLCVCLRWDLSLAWNLISRLGQLNQWVPEICISLPPQYWGYRCTAPRLAFFKHVVSEVQMEILMTAQYLILQPFPCSSPFCTEH